MDERLRACSAAAFGAFLSRARPLPLVSLRTSRHRSQHRENVTPFPPLCLPRSFAWSEACSLPFLGPTSRASEASRSKSACVLVARPAAPPMPCRAMLCADRGPDRRRMHTVGADPRPVALVGHRHPHRVLHVPLPPGQPHGLQKAGFYDATFRSFDPCLRSGRLDGSMDRVINTIMIYTLNTGALTW